MLRVESVRERMAEGIYDDVSSDELSEMDSEEMTVVIYVSKDAVRAQETNTQREARTQWTGRVTLSAVKGYYHCKVHTLNFNDCVNYIYLHLKTTTLSVFLPL